MTEPEQQEDNKAYNFRQQEARFKAELDQIMSQKAQLEKQVEALSRQKEVEEEEVDPEPYVDHKKLNKTLQKYGQSTQSEIQKAMEIAKQAAKEEIRQEMWLQQNPDFFDTMKHAEKFAMKAPQLADVILKMPEGFERQKLVYNNIKALGIDQPEKKPSEIQAKIDANKRSPYDQPSGVGTSPYSQVGDFSPTGQKAAYDKVQELKRNLRLG